MKSDGQPSGKRQRRADRLLEVDRAAVLLFSERGYAATGIRDIGGQLGVNSATLYHYVGTKEELLVRVMRNCLQQLLEAAERCTEGEASPRVKLSRIVQAHVGLSALNPLTARVTDQEVRALTEPFLSQITAMRDSYEEVIESVIELGIRTDGFSTPDARTARLAIIAMCNGVADWYRPHGRLTVVDIQVQFSDYACRIVGVDPVSAADIGRNAQRIRLHTEPLPQDERRATEEMS